MNFTQGNRRDGRLVRRGCVRPGVGSGKIGWLGRGSVRQRELEGRCGYNIVSYFAGLWEAFKAILPLLCREGFSKAPEAYNLLIRNNELMLK